jgi:hypothetical protein
VVAHTSVTCMGARALVIRIHGGTSPSLVYSVGKLSNNLIDKIIYVLMNCNCSNKSRNITDIL